MIIGHQKQWDFLKKSIEADKASHAYLFYGPSQIGKKKIAFEFAKYLNCKNLDNMPCQNCPTCYQIEKGNHPDLMIIKPEEKDSISIDQIRELKRRMSFSNSDGGYKVGIIDQAHLMTKEAQSALLKQLEEPKGKTIIILITEYPQNLLSTIVSRCQQLRFWLVPSELINEIEEEFDKSLAYFGKPGIVFNFFSHPEEEKRRKEIIEDINRLKKQDFYHRFRYADQLSKNGMINQVFETWLIYFRQLIKDKLDGGKSLWNLKELKKIIRIIEESKKLISTTNVNLKLTLELFFMEL